jgi:hypothetical protein
MPNSPLEIFVGERQAQITYQGRSGCCSAIDQIVFVIPADAPRGCYVPVVARIGELVSNYTTIAIADQRGLCTDALQMSASDVAAIQSGGDVNIAQLTLQRINGDISINGQPPLQGNVDLAEFSFKQTPSSQLLAAAGIQSVPTMATCQVQQFQYEGFLDSIFTSQNNPIQQLNLDAGPFMTVAGPNGGKQVDSESPSGGNYSARLGGIFPGEAPQPEYLDPGNYTISNGAGGSAVGAFNAQVDLPGNIVWTNRNAMPAIIPRSQPLTITWNGADGATEFVYVGGSSANPATGAGGSFVCSAPAGAGMLEIPTHVFQALPASGQAAEGFVGFLFVAKSLLRSESSANLPNAHIAYVGYLMGTLINTNYQ